MVRKLFWLALVGVHLLNPWSLFAENFSGVDHLLITEVQTGTPTSASEEFVELYNPLDSEVDITGWQLRYISASGATSTNKASLSGVIEPHTYYLLATDNYLTDTADAQMSDGLSQSGGHIAIFKPATETENEAIVDLVGWGTAAQPETMAAAPPSAGESLERLVDDEGSYIDTDNNQADFSISTSPSPGSAAQLQPDPLPTPTPDLPASYASLIINELLPDPATPQTDAEDEFVELYNPHNHSVNLENYKLQFGSSLSSSYTLPAATIPANGYYLIDSASTNLSLSNAGSRVQLLDPNGTVAGSLVSYSSAKPGRSWALIDDEYIWTTLATPGTANRFGSPPSTQKTKTRKSASRAANKTYAKLIITEVLPDPNKPLKDSTDEFVELYNPNNFPVNVADYRIKTGSTLRSSCKPQAVTIQPRSYAAFFSGNCSMSLSNAGGSAQLVDSNKTVISEIERYGKADAGLAWALIDGKWQWTAKPTPAAANQLVTPTPDMDGKAGGSNSAGSGGLFGNLSQPAALTAPPNWRLIMSVSLLAAGYMIYELRYDIRNQLYRFKRVITAKMGR